MRFEFATAGRIMFGAGTAGQAATVVRELGTRALVVTGREPGRAEPLLAGLTAAGVAVTTVATATEPTIDAVTAATERARAAGCDCVVGFGGGSVLDAAKAVAALLANPGDLTDYLEVIGRARPLSTPSVPCVAMPTTAGTGSEVTRNAVLTSSAHQLKVSLRGPHVLPRVAIVDPELTYGLPAAITAATGLDALTQLIEPYVCAKANPLTDGFCVEGIRRAGRSLRRVVELPADAAGREDMALASLLGGLALANAGLGAVHGFASPIGGRFAAPHGAVCAILLPHVMAANLQALAARAPGHQALSRYDEIGRLLTGRPQANARDAVQWVRELVHALQIPRLSRYGVHREDVSAIVAAAVNASSMKANPIALTADELAATLTAAL
jgi:alcohol dehydrogenase class IV